ncbi:MAG: ABC transporter permease [Bacteroidales bacterium]|nr:ABC transporter permease [Candidatus Cacconaster merdequi]
MDFRQNFEIALRSLRGNRLRTSLTVAIIAVGVMSLVGIQTALDIMSEKVVGSFSKMGASLFRIESKEDYAPVGLREARDFVERCDFAGSASISSLQSMTSQIRCGTKVTDPVVCVIASDENYLGSQMLALSAGRNFRREEVLSRESVAIIGDNVRRKLFGEGSGVGETVVVGNGHYVVTGTLERQGAIFGTGADNSVVIPVGGDCVCTIDILPLPEEDFMETVERSRLLMRSVRRLRPGMENDFVIVRADTMQDKLSSLKDKLSIAALAIGLVTLLGSAIGLMNIMLVSVKERTKEIGTRKALGASPATIRRHFLAESVLVGQIGGIWGILLGILFGNIVALAMEGNFTVPWEWVLMSVGICLAVSLVSGYVPASRAAALPPVEALRDE